MAMPYAIDVGSALILPVKDDISHMFKVSTMNTVHACVAVAVIFLIQEKTSTLPDNKVDTKTIHYKDYLSVTHSLLQPAFHACPE
jgi:hypothetical protein